MINTEAANDFHLVSIRKPGLLSSGNRIETDIINDFRPVTLKELDALALMNRTDTKYIFRADRLAEFLERVKSSYRVLEIEECRVMPYSSIYFDTPDYFLYRCHHNGVRCRYKVRLRDYLVSDRSFFEIKRKTNKNKTKKKRIEVPFQTGEISVDSLDFLDNNSPLGSCTLIRSLENSFSRITLASFETHERVTIDLDVKYRVGSKRLEMDRLIIAEVKRSSSSSVTPVLEALHDMNIAPGSFSKYCIGIVSMVEGVKYNNFKPKLRNINKIIA